MGVKITSLESWFKSGATLFENKCCLMVVAVVILLSLVLKFSLSKLFHSLRLAVESYPPRHGAFFGMQCSLMPNSPFISRYACTKLPLFLLSFSEVSLTAASLYLNPLGFRSS